MYAASADAVHKNNGLWGIFKVNKRFISNKKYDKTVWKKADHVSQYVWSVQYNLK